MVRGIHPAKRPAFRTLLPILALILLYFLTRTHDLWVFPPFIDEAHHISWAQDLYDLKPFTGAANGKLFGLWWMALFGLSGDGVLWLVRMATALFGCLTVATLYSLGRYFHSPAAGWTAGFTYVLLPFAFFYDRLALVDSYVTVWGMLAIWGALRFARRGRNFDAALSGLALIGALLAKATGVMLTVIPALVFLLLNPRHVWRTRLRGLVLSYGLLLAFWIPFYLLLVWRGYWYFSTATTVVGTSESSGIIERLVTNFAGVIDIDRIYFSTPVMLLIGALTVYYTARRPRVALFLLAATLLPLAGLLAFATKLSARYVLFHLPPPILLLAVGLAHLAGELSRETRLRLALPIGIIALWGVLFAWPFQARYWTDPVSLELPPLDRLEYISADSAGTALDAVATFLLEQNCPAHVIGLLANCAGLDLLIPHRSQVTIECPEVSLDGSHQTAIARLVEQRLAASQDAPFNVWIALENVPFFSLDGITARYEAVQTFERPGALTRITLYRVWPL